MTTIEYGSEVNLEELRCQLTGRFALALMGVSVLVILLIWSDFSSPLVAVLPAVALLGLGWGVRALAGVRPALARQVLVWSLSAGLLAAMWLVPDSWLPFLGLMLTFVGAMLVSGS